MHPDEQFSDENDPLADWKEQLVQKSNTDTAAIQGWLMSIVQEMETEGAKAFAFVWVTKQGSMQTNWRDPEGESWCQLITGTAVLQRHLISECDE